MVDLEGVTDVEPSSTASSASPAPASVLSVARHCSPILTRLKPLVCADCSPRSPDHDSELELTDVCRLTCSQDAVDADSAGLLGATTVFEQLAADAEAVCVRWLH